MKTETVQILTEMGIQFPNGAIAPSVSDAAPRLGIIDYGNVVGFVCPTRAEFDLVANHGGIVNKANDRGDLREWSEKDNVITVPRDRALRILREIALFRLMATEISKFNRNRSKIGRGLAKTYGELIIDKATETAMAWFESFERVKPSLPARINADFYAIGSI